MRSRRQLRGRATPLAVSSAMNVTDPHHRLRAALQVLARRERGLLVARAALGASGTLSLAFAGLGSLLAWGGGGSRSIPGGLAGAALLTLGALAFGVRGYARAGRVREQAARLEGHAPELRGALLAVLDRETRPMGSVALLERMATRVVQQVIEVPPACLHPASGLRAPAGWALAGLACLLATTAFGAWSPAQIFAALQRPEAAQNAPIVTDGPRALVGDLALRYVYPAYTRMEPVTVENSNGAIHAPPGTRVEVRARAAVRYERAAIQSYDTPPVLASADDHRQLAGNVVVAGPGIWRFVLNDTPSPDFMIVPEPDLPPDVTADAPARRVEVAVDVPLPIAWTAGDDFGLVELLLEIREGTKTRVVPMEKLLGEPREAGSRMDTSARELGISAGSTVTLRIGASDNDAVTGSKIGWSLPIEVEVLGPRGRAARDERLRLALRDALVTSLAVHVLEAVPGVADGAAANAWMERVDGAYASFDLVRVELPADGFPTFDARVVGRVMEARRALASAAGGLGRTASARDLSGLAEAQGAHLTTLENAILALDQALRMAAMASVAELVGSLADEAKELDADLSALTPAQARARLDQLERQLQQLDGRAEALDEGTLKEFVAERSAQARTLASEIRKALAEGRSQDAAVLMERLADQLEAMRRDLQEMQSRGQKSQDDSAKAMKELQAELEALQADQGALRTRTEQARDTHGANLDAAVAAWKEIEQLAVALADSVRASERERPVFRAANYANRAALDDARTETDGLRDSVRARDLGTAHERALRSVDALTWLTRRAGGPADPSFAPVARGMNLQAVRILSLLERLQRQATRTSPELQRALEDLAAEQRALDTRSDKVAKTAEQVAQGLPMDAPGLKEGTRSAVEQSSAASEALAGGDAMRAEGAQRAAEDGYAEAIAALRQAQQDMKDLQQAASGKGGGSGERGQRKGEKGDDGGKPGNGEGVRAEDFVLPKPDAFQTPEAYRKALLEGMQGAVPEEYKALNRRYYEELVRQ